MIVLINEPVLMSSMNNTCMIIPSIAASSDRNRQAGHAAGV